MIYVMFSPIYLIYRYIVFGTVYVRLAVVLLLISIVVAVDLFYMKVDVLIFRMLEQIKTFFIIQGL